MFTGIVAGTGEITEISGSDVIRLVIDFNSVSTEGLAQGASVSIDGACLTVVEINSFLACVHWRSFLLCQKINQGSNHDSATNKSQKSRCFPNHEPHPKRTQNSFQEHQYTDVCRTCATRRV